MDLNFIDLLIILQHIAIRNSPDSNNIKPQAIKGLVKQNKFGFLHSTPKNSAYNNLSSALECTKNGTLRPLAQKGCAPQPYEVFFSCLRTPFSRTFAP